MNQETPRNPQNVYKVKRYTIWYFVNANLLEGIFKLAFDLVLGNLQHKKEKTKMVFDSIVMNDGANNKADRIDKNGLNPCCCRCCCGSCCANPKYDQQTNTSSSRHNHHDNSTTRNQTTRTSSPCHKSTQK